MVSISNILFFLHLYSLTLEKTNHSPYRDESLSFDENLSEELLDEGVCKPRAPNSTKEVGSSSNILLSDKGKVSNTFKKDLLKDFCKMSKGTNKGTSAVYQLNFKNNRAIREIRGKEKA